MREGEKDASGGVLGLSQPGGAPWRVWLVVLLSFNRMASGECCGVPNTCSSCGGQTCAPGHYCTCWSFSGCWSCMGASMWGGTCPCPPGSSPPCPQFCPFSPPSPPSPPPSPPGVAPPPPPSLPPASPCAVGGAYTFTGAATSYLTATSRTGIVGGGLGFTLSSWVYRTRTDRSWDRVIDFGNGQLDGIIVAFNSEASSGMSHDVKEVSTASHLSASSATFPANVWTHVAVVQSRASLADTHGPAQIYWNGVSVATSFPSLQSNIASARFPLPVSRSNLFVGTGMFTGQMKDLLVWDVALSPAQLDGVRLGGGLPNTTAPLISLMRSWCGAAPPPPPPPPPSPPSPPPPSPPPPSPPSPPSPPPYPLTAGTASVSNTVDLTSALANTAAGHIVLAPGT